MFFIVLSAISLFASHNLRMPDVKAQPKGEAEDDSQEISAVTPVKRMKLMTLDNDSFQLS